MRLLSAAAWVHVHRLLVHAQPIAPARVFMEVTLLVPLVKITDAAGDNPFIVLFVILLRDHTNGQCIVVQVLWTKVNVSVLHDSLPESTVDVGSDSVQFRIVGLS